ncbi:unnamed protein product [Effrenium voratum]|nr:unnamed protein product [Effrenium voratum]
MEGLLPRPPGRIRMMPRLEEAAAQLEDLQQSDEPEAAMSLMTRMVTIDESMFISLFPFVAEETLITRDMMGRTLLHYAAALGRLGALSLLLGANACDPNAMDDRGDTALHLAAGNGDKGACQLLLSNARVDRSLQDDAGRTALDVAHSAAAHYFATEAVHALAM